MEAEIRAKRSHELQHARHEQQKEKEKMLEEQARAEKAEFEAVIRKQREVRELEERLEQERKELLKKHAVELKKQIVEKHEGKEEGRKERDIENQQLQETFQGQKALLERIKQEKIRELRELNVPDKYIVELENKKIH